MKTGRHHVSSKWLSLPMVIYLVEWTTTWISKCSCGRSNDLIQNIHGVAPVAELDGDEVGFLVAKVAEIKKLR